MMVRYDFINYYFYFMILHSEDSRDISSNHVDPSFKRIRTQYSSAYSSWAGQLAGSWVKQQLDIKQEKIPGAVNGVSEPETQNVSPVHSPHTASPYPSSFPDNVNFANYDSMPHHNSVYGALNPGSAGSWLVKTSELFFLLQN